MSEREPTLVLMGREVRLVLELYNHVDDLICASLREAKPRTDRFALLWTRNDVIALRDEAAAAIAKAEGKK